MSNTQIFYVSVPVKPYVYSFLETTYGNPCNFLNHPHENEWFRSLLRKPTMHYDTKYSYQFKKHVRMIDVCISHDDFYRYGWELSKTDIIHFGRKFEQLAKFTSRSVIAYFHSLGFPLKTSIELFQKHFNYSEDEWNYEALKKDFYRNASIKKLPIANIIFEKITELIMVNLSEIGTTSHFKS